VLTAGNFSTLDVFDNNAYAKDPRTQFMNWGNWTHAAYDYAADSRGFGWGAALEWYKENWALRAGRMTGPREPNGLAVDYAIGKHYGDQFEIERAHSIGNQPGKVRVLAWRNRAVLARFDDATQYLAANPSSTQAILNVRNGEQIKYGVGINIEQALSTHAGWFLRAMKADGRTETHAFTEADGSFSSGLQLKGGAWGRNDDAIGISLGRNTLSNERRRYLAAGGMSFFIGDGALSYRAEQVLEAYYSLSVNKLLTLTADAQRINNPAYNSARGPVNVYALRMHAEF
jgi:carbohydrate-selective porin OprB